MIENMKIVFIPIMPRFSFTKLESMSSKLYGCVSVMYGYTETFYLRFPSGKRPSRVYFVSVDNSLNVQ